MRTRLEIEWPMIEVKATYQVVEKFAEAEGHGLHYIDEGDKELIKLELYVAGETIDIMDKYEQIKQYTNI